MAVEWKPIFDGEFEVSSDGRIRRLFKTYHNQRIGEAKVNTSGRYARCCLSVKGEKRQFSAHRLVLLAFRGPCPEGMETAHLNGDSYDNRLENLAYVTHLENEGHKRVHGTRPRGEKQGAAKLTAAQVKEIKQRLKDGTASINGIARELGMAPQTIWAIKANLTWRHVV